MEELARIPDGVKTDSVQQSEIDKLAAEIQALNDNIREKSESVAIKTKELQQRIAETLSYVHSRSS